MDSNSTLAGCEGEDWGVNSGNGATNYCKKVAAYVASYARCFRPRLHGQLAHCQQYVKGLFPACRSNVERMNERLPDSTYDVLHHFISESSWDGLAVMDEVARRV